jgi:hypothetical protein
LHDGLKNFLLSGVYVPVPYCFVKVSDQVKGGMISRYSNCIPYTFSRPVCDYFPQVSEERLDFFQTVSAMYSEIVHGVIEV